MTPRALDIIKEMDYIACEDTRVSGKLLAHFEIQKPLVSCREHNEISGAIRIISDLKNGQKIAYLSDAGYPSISDPGNRLVSEALANGIKVSVISGANAMLNALVGSGLNSTNASTFTAFSRRKKKCVRKNFALCLNAAKHSSSMKLRTAS
jgi:16S rRNA (cytidine1402-2'-O)-methyltransferase